MTFAIRGIQTESLGWLYVRAIQSPSTLEFIVPHWYTTILYVSLSDIVILSISILLLSRSSIHCKYQISVVLAYIVNQLNFHGVYHYWNTPYYIRKSRGTLRLVNGRTFWLHLFIIRQSLLEEFYSTKIAHKDNRHFIPTSLCAYGSLLSQISSRGLLASSREQLDNNNFFCALLAG